MSLSDQPGFYDLCINATEDLRELKAILSKLCKLGYGTVAINYNFDEALLVSGKKKKKNRNDDSDKTLVPDPVDVETLAEEFKGKLRIISRITFSFSDVGKTHIFNYCPNLKKYYLYAAAPRSQNALLFACSQLNADLITIRPDASGLKLNRKLYKQAIDRGLHFEIQYSDLLVQENRKNAFHHAHLFHTYGKSKNVILSSNAASLAEIRGPYDIINLSALLGLSETQSKAAIFHQARSLLLRAERRRKGKAVFNITSVEEVKEDQVNCRPKRIKT